LREGDVGYVPMGFGHALRNDGSTATDVLVVFNNGDYQSINLSEWLASNPTSVVANNLQIPTALADRLPKRDADFAP
jgi:oxalate decarboxylase